MKFDDLIVNYLGEFGVNIFPSFKNTVLIFYSHRSLSALPEGPTLSAMPSNADHLHERLELDIRWRRCSAKVCQNTNYLFSKINVTGVDFPMNQWTATTIGVCPTVSSTSAHARITRHTGPTTNARLKSANS